MGKWLLLGGAGTAIFFYFRSRKSPSLEGPPQSSTPPVGDFPSSTGTPQGHGHGDHPYDPNNPMLIAGYEGLSGRRRRKYCELRAPSYPHATKRVKVRKRNYVTGRMSYTFVPKIVKGRCIQWSEG